MYNKKIHILSIIFYMEVLIMPGSITHYLFAQDCLSKIKDTNIKSIISNNIDSYILGSYGPNFFAYCNYFPFVSRKDISTLSELIHNQHINLFIKHMISYSTDTSCIRYAFNNPDFFDITISYIHGFLSHYVLDKFLHPYIYNLQFNLRNQYKMKTSKSLHKSIETHIDTLLLYKFKNLNPNEFNEYTRINLSQEKLLIICDMYKFLIKDIFDKSILYSDISKCIDMFTRTEKRLNSSNKFYSHPYLYLKKIASKTSYIDSKIYSKHKYCMNDLLNEDRLKWKDPFSNKISSCSLIDIYYDSINFYLDLVNTLNLYLNNKSTMLDILSKINDKSFFTNQNWKVNHKNLYQ